VLFFDVRGFLLLKLNIRPKIPSNKRGRGKSVLIGRNAEFMIYNVTSESKNNKKLNSR